MLVIFTLKKFNAIRRLDARSSLNKHESTLKVKCFKVQKKTIQYRKREIKTSKMKQRIKAYVMRMIFCNFCTNLLLKKEFNDVIYEETNTVVFWKREAARGYSIQN